MEELARRQTATLPLAFHICARIPFFPAKFGATPKPLRVHIVHPHQAMLGIGIDILSITRFEGLLARRGAQALARRICSKREYDEFRSVPADQHVKYLSSRYVPHQYTIQPYSAEYSSQRAKKLTRQVVPKRSGVQIPLLSHPSPLDRLRHPYFLLLRAHYTLHGPPFAPLGRDAEKGGGGDDGESVE